MNQKCCSMFCARPIANISFRCQPRSIKTKVWSLLALPILWLLQRHMNRGTVIITHNVISASSWYKQLLQYLSGPNGPFRTFDYIILWRAGIICIFTVRACTRTLFCNRLTPNRLSELVFSVKRTDLTYVELPWPYLLSPSVPLNPRRLFKAINLKSFGNQKSRLNGWL